jgi:hypothetical protein
MILLNQRERELNPEDLKKMLQELEERSKANKKVKS